MVATGKIFRSGQPGRPSPRDVVRLRNVFWQYMRDAFSEAELTDHNTRLGQLMIFLDNIMAPVQHLLPRKQAFPGTAYDARMVACRVWALMGFVQNKYVGIPGDDDFLGEAEAKFLVPWFSDMVRDAVFVHSHLSVRRATNLSCGLTRTSRVI